MRLSPGLLSCILAVPGLLTAAERPPILNSYEQLPLSFEPNLGQTDPRAQFVARSAGYTLLLGPSEAQMVLASVSRNQAAALRMTLDGASPTARPAALDRQPGVSAYFIGNDPSRWLPEVPHYGRIQYESVYSGIDLVYYGNGKQVEYDFVLHPGADSSRIRLSYAGAERIRIDPVSGDLILTTPLGDLRQRKPRVYQAASGRQVEVPTAYRLNGQQVSFDVTLYDRTLPLVIDPVLIYSTYLGGNTQIKDMAMDAAGAVYVAGITSSYNFPIVNAYEPGIVGPLRVLHTAFVTKLNPYRSGQITLAYSTYLGGSNADAANGVAVDSTGAAYVSGTTNSLDFPILHAYQATIPSGTNGSLSGFVAKLNPYSGTGPVTLSYSTYLGGDYQYLGKIAVDSTGAAYVVGEAYAANFPSVNALRPFQVDDALLARFNPYNGSGNLTLAYSTSLGPGSANAVAVDSTGAAYVAGAAGIAGNQHAFAAKVNPFTGGPVTLAYSTLLGGSGNDSANAIAVDSAGAAYVAGNTMSADFPVVNAWQSRYSGNGDAFVARLNPVSASGAVTLGFSTFLGGAASDIAYAISLDSSGAVYVTGSTSSANFPILDPSPSGFAGILGETFVTKFNPPGNGPLTLAYSTLIGGNVTLTRGIILPDAGTGIAIEPSGAIQVAGYTYSPDFPLLNAFQSTYIDIITDAVLDSDGFAVKLPPPGTVVKTPVNVTVTSPTLSSGQSVVVGQPITLTATFTGASGPPVTGTVWFVGSSQGIVLCSAPISNGAATCATPQTNEIVGGANTITAGYPGDSTYTLGTVTPLTFTVGLAPTTTTLSISPNPPVPGPVTLTATVAITPPGAVFQNSGTVTFTQNGVTIPGCLALAPPPATFCYHGCSSPITQFSVSCYFASLGPPGTTYGAQYSGDTWSTPSTGTLVVNSSRGAVPDFDIHATFAPIYGQPITFSADYVPVPGLAPPTGTLTFNDTTNLGTSPLATVPVSAASVTAPSPGISALIAGFHMITLTYNGDSNYASGVLPFTGVNLGILKADTATTLTAQGGALTAAVSAVPPGAGTPTGAVQFFNGVTSIGTAALVESGTQSVAVLNIGALTGNITATYSGDSNFNRSASAVLSVANNPQPPVFVTLTLTPSADPAPIGLPVTLTVSVTGNGPASVPPPRGTVQFFDSASLLGAAAVSGGQATLVVTFQVLGAHNLLVLYSGDSVYPSESLVSGLYVVRNAATVTVTSTANQTFTVQVSGAAGLPPPSGTVQLLYDATVVATVPLTNGAVSLTAASRLSPGTHRISASYSGDAVFGPAVSAVLIQVVTGGTFTFQAPNGRGR